MHGVVMQHAALCFVPPAEQLKQQLQEVEAELQAAFAAMQAEPAAGKQQQQALLTAFVTFDTEEAMQASEQSCPQGRSA